MKLRQLLGVCGCGIALGLSGWALAESQQLSESLAETTIVAFTGGAGEHAGYAVADAGDINQDGLADSLVGAWVADPLGRNNAGTSYLIWGQALTATLQAPDLAERGVAIYGASEGASSGWSVTGLGDVNGDQIDDVAIGAWGESPNNRATAGSVFVVWGGSLTTTLDLAALGNHGYRIDGALAGDRLGYALAGVEDLNNDGLNEIVIGAIGVDASADNAGAAYVVWGKATTTTLDLATASDYGYRIDGAAANDRAGSAVGSTSDMNGDGKPELLVGSYVADPFGRSAAGSVAVVWGASTTTSYPIGALAQNGFVIAGAGVSDRAGISLVGTGDLNGDQRGDLAVGSDQFPAGGAGRVDLVYGAAFSGTLDLAQPLSNTVRFVGEQAGDEAGFSVGYSDQRLIIGAYGVDSSLGSDTGRVYVVNTPPISNTINLANLTIEQGFSLDGVVGGGRLGRAVAGLGDATGDGHGDLLLGADLAGSQIEGYAYIVGRLPTTVYMPMIMR